MNDPRKDNLVEVAVKVIAEKGFEQAKVHDISNEAGIGTGVIYSRKFYINKLDMMLSIVLDFWKDLNKKIHEEVNQLQEPEQKLQKVLSIAGEWLKGDEQSVYRFRVVQEALPYIYFVEEKDEELQKKRQDISAENRKLLNELDNIIQDGQNRDVFDASLKASVMRQVLFGAFELLMHGLFLKKSGKEPGIDYEGKDVLEAMHLLVDKFVSVPINKSKAEFHGQLHREDSIRKPLLSS